MKTNPTAKKMKELRAAGCKIRVTHHRFTRSADGSGPSIMLSVREIDEANAKFKVMGMEPFFISPNGGKVTVEIETPDGKQFQAESECSERDNFQRKIGTAIAFGRAVQVKELVGQSDVNAPYPVGAAVRNLSRGVLGTVVGNRSRMVGEETVFDYVIEDANRVCDLVGEDRVEAA